MLHAFTAAPGRPATSHALHLLDTPGSPTNERDELPALKVERRGNQWAVVIEGRVVATAPTRERARQRARILRSDPDFSDVMPA